MLYDNLKLVHFSDRCRYHTSVLMFKAIHGKVPFYISNNIIFSYEVSGLNLRSLDTMNLYMPLPNVEVFTNAPMYRGPSVWNELPLHLKNCTKVQSFINMYKRLFF